MYRCPIASCSSSVQFVGGLHVEGGEYSIERDTYEVEGDVETMKCESGHTFAIDVPVVEDESSEDLA